jgi:hypothetical protein
MLLIVLIVISIDKSLLCRIRRYIVHSWIKTKQLKKVADIITFFALSEKSDTSNTKNQ